MDFNNNQNQSDSVFANWLIKKGIVKNEAAANAVMIVFIIVGFSFSIFMIFK